jgi:hypothetical protein
VFNQKPWSPDDVRRREIPQSLTDPPREDRGRRARIMRNTPKGFVAAATALALTLVLGLSIAGSTSANPLLGAVQPS